MSHIFWQVKTTPHVSGSVNPVWESVTEFLVKDFTKVREQHISLKVISFTYSDDRMFVVFSDQRFLSGV